MTLTPSPKARKSLSAAEREVILTKADDEETWTVFSDSPTFARRLRNVAAAWGLPAPDGEGFLTLPLRAVRFVLPPSARQRAAGRASIQNARRGLKPLVRGEVLAGPAPGGDV